MFDPSGYFFYILLAIIISIGIFSWYRSKNLAGPQKALVKLRYSLIIFGVIVAALICNLPYFWTLSHIDAQDISTLDKAAKAVQEQNEYLRQMNKSLTEFRYVIFFFMQVALVHLCFSIYNFAKALVDKDTAPSENETPLNIIGLNDEKLTKEI